MEIVPLKQEESNELAEKIYQLIYEKLNAPEYMSIKEYASSRGLSYDTVKEMVERIVDPIPHLKHGKNVKKIAVKDADRWLRGKQVGRREYV